MVGDKFSNIDVLRCFFLIGEKGPISKKEMYFQLDLDEKIITDILSIMKSKSLVISTRKGSFLTERGQNFLDILKEYVSIPKCVTTPYYPGKKQVAVKIKTHKEIDLKKAHRDIAIEAGADTAIILKLNNRLHAEGIGFDEFDDLETLFDFKFNHILIITFADSVKIAANAALAVAFNLDTRITKELGEIELV